MLSNGRLIELALGEEEARKVDTAIPQEVFDSLNLSERANTAGWYYEGRSLMGRRLTVPECWNLIHQRIGRGELRLFMLGQDVTYVVKDWFCLRYHIERGEIQVEEAQPDDPRRI